VRTGGGVTGDEPLRDVRCRIARLGAVHRERHASAFPHVMAIDSPL